MGHQIVIYGMIEGPAAGDQMRALKEHNDAIIRGLPAEDQWPWLTRSMFALPGRWPQGTYREQIIHFGLSMKDDPPLSPNSAFKPDRGWPKEDRKSVYGWIEKFEKLLREMFWFGANVHLITEFEADRVFYYPPTKAAFMPIASLAPEITTTLLPRPS
jgi:hypothetical protein